MHVEVPEWVILCSTFNSYQSLSLWTVAISYRSVLSTHLTVDLQYISATGLISGHRTCNLLLRSLLQASNSFSSSVQFEIKEK
jgi:hypothetical protein